MRRGGRPQAAEPEPRELFVRSASRYGRPVVTMRARDLGEVDPALAGHHLDQRQEVGGDALLTGLKKGECTEEEVTLEVVEGGPVRAVAREVELLWIPRAETLCFLKEAHRNGVPVQAAAGDGGVGQAGTSLGLKWWSARTLRSQRPNEVTPLAQPLPAEKRHRVGEPVKSSCRMPKTQSGATRKHELAFGSTMSSV